MEIGSRFVTGAAARGAPEVDETLGRLSLDQLRAHRDRLRTEQAAVSCWRRLAQGGLDAVLDGWPYLPSPADARGQPKDLHSDLDRATAELVRRYRVRPQDCLSLLAARDRSA